MSSTTTIYTMSGDKYVLTHNGDVQAPSSGLRRLANSERWSDQCPVYGEGEEETTYRGYTWQAIPKTTTRFFPKNYSADAYEPGLPVEEIDDRDSVWFCVTEMSCALGNDKMMAAIDRMNGEGSKLYLERECRDAIRNARTFATSGDSFLSCECEDCMAVERNQVGDITCDCGHEHYVCIDCYENGRVPTECPGCQYDAECLAERGTGWY